MDAVDVLYILLCVLPVAGFALLFSRKIKSKMVKTVIVLMSCFVLSPILYFVSGFWISNAATTINNEPFDKGNWMSDKSVRYKYGLDLGTSALLNGMHTDDVILLLGSPETRRANSFQYDLAAYSWRNKWGLKAWLDIEFENDTVSTHFFECY